jgi:hypothetical protein
MIMTQQHRMTHSRELISVSFILTQRGILFWLEKQLAVDPLKRDNDIHLKFMGGRHGFDVVVEAEVACRGCLVGLAKNPGKTLSADTELALAA